MLPGYKSVLGAGGPELDKTLSQNVAARWGTGTAGLGKFQWGRAGQALDEGQLRRVRNGAYLQVKWGCPGRTLEFRTTDRDYIIFCNHTDLEVIHEANKSGPPCNGKIPQQNQTLF